VSITDDSVYEGNETVTLTLTSPTGGATLGSPGTATLTIIENDAYQISLISPNGGESLVAGAIHQISWNNSARGGNVQLRYSIDGGSNWKKIINSTANDGKYAWKVPNDPCKQARLEILDLGSLNKDISGNFTIKAPQTLSYAVDNTNLTFNSGASSKWFWQNAKRYYDGDSAQSGNVFDNQESSMQTSVTGPGTLSFYWSVSSEKNCDYLRFTIDGVQMDSISGSIGWTKRSFSIPSGTHTLKWRYTKDAEGAAGLDCGWVDKVEWIKGSQTISYAVESPSLIFMTGGSTGWYWQNFSSYYGEDAARSGNIEDRQNLWMQTTVTGPGELSFYWKVSSQSGSDFLRFFVDNTSKGAISGNGGWAKKSFAIPSGKHSLKWRYDKDSAGSDGADCGWIDKIRFIPE
jgi:hypothetical protein